MSIHGKILAAAAVPVMAAGVALTAGGSANAATQAPPAPIGYTIAATSAHSDSISHITATFGTPPTSVVGSTAVSVPVTSPVQFGATDSLGTAVSWSVSGQPTGFSVSAAGALTLAPAPVTAPAAFTVKATDGSAAAIAHVHVAARTTSGEASIYDAQDTVVLRTP